MSASPVIFLGANTPWVYPLARGMAAGPRRVVAVAPYDWLNFRRLRPRWPAGEVPAGLRRAFWTLPPGYTGTLAAFFAPLLRWRLRRVAAELGGDAFPWVVVVYPWFARAVRGVPDERLVYYNVDDYSLYHPARAALIREQEDELLRRAALTVCASLRQADALRARVSPARAGLVRHSPHGVEESYLSPCPQNPPPTRTVGYVGNLIDRVDWRLVADTARAMPDVEFIFVGGLDGSGGGGMRPAWEAERDLALALPNVRRVGPVPQKEVPRHFWSFGVNWIPYAVDHAFNQAACPTKIMDCLASGRPVVGTNLPEFRLYPEWIAIAGDALATVRALRDSLAADARPHAGARAVQQVAFARQNTWGARSATLASWLAEREAAQKSLPKDSILPLLS